MVSHYNAKIAGRSATTCNTPLPSLVVCPSTVCGHWKDEIRKFIANRQDLDCLIYGQKSHLSRSSGNLGRNSQKEHIMDLISNKKVENLVVISSYDIVRSDVEFFSSYCIIVDDWYVLNVPSHVDFAYVNFDFSGMDTTVVLNMCIF